MDKLNFIWDEQKAALNLQKHGVSFAEAKTVFHDEFARLIADPEHSDNEDRFILLGLGTKLRLLIVCHCYKETEQTIRIISARKANRNEQRLYEKFSHER